MRRVQVAGDTPRDRLLAVFDVAEAWFRQPDFYGCPFINAVGEYSAAASAIRTVCREFKALMKAFIRELCVAADANNPDDLADQLDLLLEGAIVTAQVCDQPQAARTAKIVARQLIELGCPKI